MDRFLRKNFEIDVKLPLAILISLLVYILVFKNSDVQADPPKLVAYTPVNIAQNEYSMIIDPKGIVGQVFGNQCSDPEGRFGESHNPKYDNDYYPGYSSKYAIDIHGKVGEPVKAFLGGLVTLAGVDPRVSNIETGFPTKSIKVVLLHEKEGYRTFYAHLDSVDVNVGDYVSAGDIIGKMGKTGIAYYPHLHFQIGTVNSEQEIGFEANLDPACFRELHLELYKTNVDAGLAPYKNMGACFGNNYENYYNENCINN